MKLAEAYGHAAPKVNYRTGVGAESAAWSRSPVRQWARRATNARGPLARMPRDRFSIVVTGLKEVDAVLPDQIHEPVLLREPARPGSGREVLQRLRLADTSEGIAENGLHQFQSPESDPTVCLDPVPKVLSELGLKDGIARAPTLSIVASRLRQARALGAGTPPTEASPCG